MTTPEPATPPVVGRDNYERTLAQQVEIEKELTRFGDRVSARRRRLPMTSIEDYVFDGDNGPVRLSEMFGEHPQLVLQSFMFHPDWDEGCPSCTWAANNTFNTDWGWTIDGQDQPGYSYLLRTNDGPFLTYRTERRGTEAILPTTAIWDRAVYGRQQDFEDSPERWPQQPTYG